MIQVTELSFGYSEHPLYSHVNFRISRGQKVGLVGANGSGKSTLLKILAGKEDAYSGRVVCEGTIGMVPQEVKHDPDLVASTSVRSYVDPTHSFEDHVIRTFFAGLELSLSLNAATEGLSGGQKTKLALARALLANPDILMLDEPTNFMDIAGKKWVMKFLADYEGTVIVISHDLELMDHAIEKVLFVNVPKREIDEYKGNYTQFLKLKKEKEELLKREIIVKEKHIKQMEEGLKKMARFTSGKGVRARTRQKRRIEKEKLALPTLPADVRAIKLNLPDPAPVGELPVRALLISKAYGDRTILDKVSITIKRGERIALIGPNGTGKSTLIKIIMGRITPDTGDVILNPQLKVGYYSQEFETFDFEKTMIETFIDETKTDEKFARSFLGRYMFPGEKVFQKVGSLSGGEKTRLSIAIVTAQNNNLLVLDEPTTYLDVLSQRIILEALKEYKGTMILVSHTPEFVKDLHPTRAMMFPGGKVSYWDDELLGVVDEL